MESSFVSEKFGQLMIFLKRWFVSSSSSGKKANPCLPKQADARERVARLKGLP